MSNPALLKAETEWKRDFQTPSTPEKSWENWRYRMPAPTSSMPKETYAIRRSRRMIPPTMCSPRASRKVIRS